MRTRVLVAVVSVVVSLAEMTADQMNALVESAKKKGEWLVFMIHGMARGYDAWENPQELEKHLAWVKEQKDVRVLSFADAVKDNP